MMTDLEIGEEAGAVTEVSPGDPAGAEVVAAETPATVVTEDETVGKTDVEDPAGTGAVLLTDVEVMHRQTERRAPVTGVVTE